MEENYKNLPVYQKAMQIFDLIDSLTAVVLKVDDKEAISNNFKYTMINESAQSMMQNAMIIPAKIAGAEGGDLYDIRMQNAAIIRNAAKQIITDSYSFEMFTPQALNNKDIEYINLLREEMEEFRVLFAEWVKSFDVWNYHIDRWGVFNPPGVNYDDHDPDDDIPFNPNDFFDDLD